MIRSDTGEALPGSNGGISILLVQDGADVERFLRTLHDRCWLAGFGWNMVGAGGQLLERSIVDRMVYAPEAIGIRGRPGPRTAAGAGRCQPPAVAHEAMALDTRNACPALTIVEKAELRGPAAKETYRLAPDRAKAREAFIDQAGRTRSPSA